MTKERLAWIRGYDSGKIWLTKIGDTTAERYIGYFEQYCKVTNYNPDQLLKLKPKLKELLILVQKGDDSIDED